MKKIIASLVFTVATFSAQSDIVNGNFTSGEAGRIVNLKSITSIGKGWYANNIIAQHFEFNSGSITLNTTATITKPAIIGQLFTYNETGERALNFDVAVVDNNANLDFWIQLYGYKQLTKEKTILFGSSLKLGSTDAPVSTEYYAITELINFAHIHTGTISNGTFVTESVEFIASTNYAFYGIRIMANRPDADDKITFDNVNITPVPTQ